jgi:hypothetical protein
MRLIGRASPNLPNGRDKLSQGGAYKSMTL